MIQISAQMGVLVAIEPVDGRKGIDSLARLYWDGLAGDLFSGGVFVFRSRSGAAIRLLTDDRPGLLACSETALEGAIHLVAGSGQTCQAIGSLRSAVADGSRRSFASAGRADVAASQRAEVKIPAKKSLNPLRSKHK